MRTTWVLCAHVRRPVQRERHYRTTAAKSGIKRFDGIKVCKSVELCFRGKTLRRRLNGWAHEDRNGVRVRRQATRWFNADKVSTVENKAKEKQKNVKEKRKRKLFARPNILWATVCRSRLLSRSESKDKNEQIEDDGDGDRQWRHASKTTDGPGMEQARRNV